MKQADQKTGRVTQAFAAVLFVSLLVSAVCFYATDQKYFFSRALQVIAALLATAYAVDSIASFRRVTRAASRDRQSIAGISVNIMSFVLLAMVTAASLMGLISPRHLPWILPVTVIASPFILLIGHGPLMEKETVVTVQFLAGAIVAGALTWGQLALVEHFDTWLFLMVGFIPIPVLGITVLIAGVTSVFCVLVTICGAVFHIVRVAYRVS